MGQKPARQQGGKLFKLDNTLADARVSALEKQKKAVNKTAFF